MMTTLVSPKKDDHTEEESKRIWCFVCSGNTCRSPMAEAVANRLLCDRGIVAVSAGLWVPTPAPIANNAVAALKERGFEPEEPFDYRRHVARQLNDGILADSERVYGMTPSHTAAILAAFPQFASKLCPFGASVPDPYGGDLDTYLSALDVIIAAVKKLS